MADVTYSAEFTLKVDELKKAVVDAQKGMQKLKEEFTKGTLGVEEFKQANDKAAAALKTQTSVLAAMTAGTREAENASAALSEKLRDLLPDSVKKFMAVWEALKKATSLREQASEAEALGGKLQGALSGAGGAAKNFGTALKNAITHPLQSVKNLGTALQGVFSSALAAAKNFGSGALNAAKSAGAGLKNAFTHPLQSVKSLGAGLKGALAGGAKAIGGLAKGLASGMAAGVKGAIQFGVALNVATGGLLLVIGAIAGIGIAIKKGVDEQARFNKAVNTQKAAWDAMKSSVDAAGASVKKTAEEAKAGERAAVAQYLAWEKIGDFFSNTFSPIIDGIKNTFTLITNGIGALAKAVHLVSEEEIEAATNAKKYEENYTAITEAAKEYETTIAVIARDTAKGDAERLQAMNAYIDALSKQSVLMGGVDAKVEKTLNDMITRRDALAASLAVTEDAQAAYNVEMENLAMLEKAELKNTKDLMTARKQAATTYITALEKEYTAAERNKGAYSAEAAAIAEKIRLAQEVVRINTESEAGAEDEIKTEEEKESLLEQEIARREEINSALQAAKLSADAILQVDTDNANQIEVASERTKELEAAQKKYREALAAAGNQAEINLRTIQRQFNIIESESPNFVKVLQDAQKTYAENIDKAAEVNELEGVRNGISKAYLEQKKAEAILNTKLENGLLTQKEYEEAITMSIETQKNAVAALAGEYGGIPGALEEINAAIAEIEGAPAKIDYRAKAGEIAGYAGEVGSALTDMTGSFAEIQKNQLQEQIDTINEMLEAQLTALDEQRQAALEAAGFAAATNEESLAAAMEAAVETGDQVVIDVEKRRQEELAINKDFDEKEKKAKEKAAKEVAELEYQMAMSDWQNQLSQAAVSIAQAILTGYAQMGPIGGSIGAGIMAGVGAAQIGAIMTGQPKKKFAKGYDPNELLPLSAYRNSIVNTPTTFALGGTPALMGEAGAEAIMPLERMESGELGVNAATGGAGVILLSVYLDNVAAGTVRLINDGITDKINVRMIAQ